MSHGVFQRTGEAGYKYGKTHFDENTFSTADYLDRPSGELLETALVLKAGAIPRVNALIGRFAEEIQKASMMPAQEVVEQMQRAESGPPGLNLRTVLRFDNSKSSTLSSANVREVIRTTLAHLLKDLILLIEEPQQAAVQAKISTMQRPYASLQDLSSGMDEEAQNIIEAMGLDPRRADVALTEITKSIVDEAGLSNAKIMVDVLDANNDGNKGTAPLPIVMEGDIRILSRAPETKYSTLHPQSLCDTVGVLARGGRLFYLISHADKDVRDRAFRGLAANAIKKDIPHSEPGTSTVNVL